MREGQLCETRESRTELVEGKRENDFMGWTVAKEVNAKNCSRAIRVARGSKIWARLFFLSPSLAVIVWNVAVEFVLPRFCREVDYIYCGCRYLRPIDDIRL